MSKNEAVQMDRAAISPTISTVKRDRTLIITFPFLNVNKARASAKSQ
jgi:hypothetical protein